MLSQGRANFSGRNETSSFPPQQREFVSESVGGTFWTKSEPFLTKIRTATFNCRPQGGNPAQRFRPPPLCFGEQNRKIFVSLIEKNFGGAPLKNVKKIFLFYSRLWRGEAVIAQNSNFEKWRKERDSNPRGLLTHLLSKQAP